MNIFVFNEDTKLAATDHCAKHMVKMPLELTQMLCTNVNLKGIVTPYKSCHVNHPCTKWVRESKENFDWACEHTQALFENYSKFFKKIHKSQAVFELVKNYNSLFEAKGLTPFAQAMPDVYKNSDVTIAYRNYFKGEKLHLAEWKGQKPSWA